MAFEGDPLRCREVGQRLTPIDYAREVRVKAKSMAQDYYDVASDVSRANTRRRTTNASRTAASSGGVTPRTSTRKTERDLSKQMDQTLIETGYN